MLTQNDEKNLLSRGISVQQIQEQLKSFANGFPFLEIRNAAGINKGIVKIDAEQIKNTLQYWENYLQSEARILKFVPASGAASRMFKDLFEFMEGTSSTPSTKFELKFFEDIRKFAFFDTLNNACLKNECKDIDTLMEEGNYKAIVANLLLDKGLNYGSLPKGLLLFHSYTEGKRTPMQEHLVEGAVYACNKLNTVNIHFTVSHEHRSLFESHLKESLPAFEKQFGIKYNVGFSEQKSSTDTIAADEYNQPFRDKDELVFRPGGHGALIENLNDLDGDIIFIKNIDNVVPDSLKEDTITYKKVIAGMLVEIQQRTFAYLHKLEDSGISNEMLTEIALFNENTLNNYTDTSKLSKEELQSYLIGKLNRPIRVCGMVLNVGEPGGGPFLTVNQDGSVSPQILESSQINMNNPDDKAKLQQSTHFNPVDLVCAVKNYKGEKFNLVEYVDKNTGFISLKSKNGKELKALELPGLWNGAMSNWNTIFVEVPITTFNPVKTVNDLLRTEHQ